MPDERQDDYLGRALLRRQIGRREYDAGRRWQTLHKNACSGDAEAEKILDALWLVPRSMSLLCDVLGSAADGIDREAMLARYWP